MAHPKVRPDWSAPEECQSSPDTLNPTLRAKSLLRAAARAGGASPEHEPAAGRLVPDVASATASKCRRGPGHKPTPATSSTRSSMGSLEELSPPAPSVQTPTDAIAQDAGGGNATLSGQLDDGPAHRPGRRRGTLRPLLSAGGCEVYSHQQHRALCRVAWSWGSFPPLTGRRSS